MMGKPEFLAGRNWKIAMTLVQIFEIANDGPKHSATVAFNGEGGFPIAIQDPFSPEEEKRLEWYFEQHLRFPFVETVRAAEAAKSVQTYGEALFEQVFADRDAYGRYLQAIPAGPASLRWEIIGSHRLQRLHWEALKDPKRPRPFALESSVLRKSPKPGVPQIPDRRFTTLRILLVTARPDGPDDVAYRTISRPLLDALRNANVMARVDILRPATYEALVQHLRGIQETHGPGYYQILHCDMHGVVATHDELTRASAAAKYLFQARYGRADLAAYQGHRAFLFFDTAEPGKADPVEASELAQLLLDQQIPVVMLNACQSAKELGGDRETSLAGYLLEGGVQTVLAMGYSITVSAAERLLGRLYPRLFQDGNLAQAISRGREELYNDKTRQAYFNSRIDLEDWVLPVVYQNRETPLKPDPPTPAEEAEFFGQRAESWPEPETTYGFHGRDLDVLEIERRLLLRRNILLVSGMGGVGKTTLLQHLAAWWQRTGFVDRVFAFEYDKKPWTRQQILFELSRKLLDKYQQVTFDALPDGAQQARIVALLRGNRHLLILDNLESVTGEQLAIGHALSQAEQEKVREFVGELRGGRSLVLLGARGPAAWLAQGTFDQEIYDLPGLDPEAASRLADAVLDRNGARTRREEPETAKLVGLLGGYPLAIEVVLANLKTQSAKEVLEALLAGDPLIDDSSKESKTKSILRCIEYSYSNLSPEAQQVLLCLAPFTGFINEELLPRYAEELGKHESLGSLALQHLPQLVDEAKRWGLLKPSQVPGYLEIQPTFPYFLKARLRAEPDQNFTSAIEIAFEAVMSGLAKKVSSLFDSQDPKMRQVGLIVGRLELANLEAALLAASKSGRSVIQLFVAVSRIMTANRDFGGLLALGQGVLDAMEASPATLRHPRFTIEMIGVVDHLALKNLQLRTYAEAERLYTKALELLDSFLATNPDNQLGVGRAAVLHQLGRVAQGQRNWTQAENYYQKALAIKIAFNERYEQASTLHQLGTVAQAQRNWTQAADYYPMALAIFMEFNERYDQAKTLHQLGIVAQEQRNWTHAEDYYRKALAIKIECNARYDQASTLHQLGSVAREQRNWTQAKSYLILALQIFGEFQDEHSTLITLRSLRNLWKQSKDSSLLAEVGQVLSLTPAEVEELLGKLPED
jgi:tetratricopeptide (TPR) repeat protein